jgi:hypothetical protein
MYVHTYEREGSTRNTGAEVRYVLYIHTYIHTCRVLYAYIHTQVGSIHIDWLPQTELRLALKTSSVPLAHILEHGVSLTVPLNNRPDTFSNNFAGQINGIVRNVSVCCIKGAVFTKALHPFLQPTPIRDTSVVQSLVSYSSYRI